MHHINMAHTKIFINAINEMADAQKAIIGGENKKQYVMQKIKEHMNKDDYERYEPMISLSIDFIIYLSTNKYICQIRSKIKSVFRVFQIKILLCIK